MIKRVIFDKIVLFLLPCFYAGIQSWYFYFLASYFWADSRNSLLHIIGMARKRKMETESHYSHVKVALPLLTLAIGTSHIQS